MKKLLQDFYFQKTEDVAQQLLGKTLVRIWRGKRISGIITETEAYLGVKDKACHTYGGRRTKRTEAMYLPGGHAYVYFVYGMYFCFNVVTRSTQEPEAVLIRGLEPIEGLEQMKKWRTTERLNNLASGPGKLCQALNIDKSLNTKSLLENEIFIEDSSEKITRSKIIKSPRIGIHYAEEAIHWPLRFTLEN